MHSQRVDGLFMAVKFDLWSYTGREAIGIFGVFPYPYCAVEARRSDLRWGDEFRR